MLANKSSSPSGQNGVTEIAIDLPLELRTYNQNGRIEQAPGSPFVPASEDPGITGVATRDAVIDRDTGLAARLFLPIPAVATGRRLPLVVFFHGSGSSLIAAAAAAAATESAFCLTYHRYATALAARAGALVVSVEYQLSTEHAAGDDGAWSALRWAASSSADPWLLYHADRRRTFLAGDGAGCDVAWRAAVRARRACEDVHVEGMLLVDPYLFGERECLTSLEKARSCGFVSPAENAPLPCRRALVVSAAVVGERGRRLAASIMRGGCWWGCEVNVVELHGEDDGFYLYGPASAIAERLMESIVEFVNRKDCGDEVAASFKSSGPCKPASEELPRRTVTRSCL